MFILKDYIKKGFLEAIGKMGDYQIILNSAGWFEKGVLTEDDIAEIQSAIDAQYPQVEFDDETIEYEITSDAVITEGEISEKNTESDLNNETVDEEVIKHE